MISGRKSAIGAVVFAMLVLLAVNIGWWWYYHSMTDYLESQLSRRLSGVAAAAALHISADDIEDILIEDLSVYVRTIEYLDSLAVIDSLSEAAILDLDLFYILSTRDDIMADESYLLGQLNIDYLQLAISGNIIASDLYNVDGTYLKSAYAPLYDAKGRISALIVVEAGVGYFNLLSILRNNLIILAGGSAGVVIILLVLYIIFSRRMAAVEEKIYKTGSQAALGRMVAVVSHEIKNPLMILRTAGERLDKKYDDPEASYVTEEAARLDNIVSGYLSFAKGDRSLSMEMINPGDLIRKISANIQSQLNEKGITLEESIDENLPDIKADKIGLRQVILNLLMNAMQAVDNLTEKNKGLIRISIKAEAETVVIRVSDNGPGVRLKDREKLFEPFFTTKTKGSGLGLYLARQIINLHNGTIEFIDENKQMTTLEIILPTGNIK